MGTHPIFESDFDCLTETSRTSVEQKMETAAAQAEMCVNERRGVELCHAFGQQNYRIHESFKADVPYMPLECQIFEKNLDSCNAFWERVAGRYHQEKIFVDRGGYPDKAAHGVITHELEKQDSLPYKRLTDVYLKEFESL